MSKNKLDDWMKEKGLTEKDIDRALEKEAEQTRMINQSKYLIPCKDEAELNSYNMAKVLGHILEALSDLMKAINRLETKIEN